MKRIIFFAVFFYSLQNLRSSPLAAIITLKAGESSAPYYKNSGGSITFPVTVTLNYNGVGVTAPETINLTTANSTSPSLIANGQGPTAIVIAAADFQPNVLTRTVLVNITINAVASLYHSESVDIIIVGAQVGSPFHRLVIKPVAIGEVQATFRIEQLQAIKMDSVAPIERETNASHEEVFTLKYRATGKLTKDTVIALEINGDGGNTTEVELVTKELIIREADMQDGVKEGEYQVRYKVKSVKAFSADETAFIGIKGSNEKSTITITRSKLNIANKPFWVEIGTNLDLQDKITPNNFFTGVFLYKRDVGRFSLRNNCNSDKKNMNVAILGGIYHSKSTSSELVGTLPSFYSGNQSFLRDAQGRRTVFVDTGTTSVNVSVNTVSLFLSPQVRLTRKPANNEGLHIFAALWLEYLWQRTGSNNDYSKRNNLDTFHVLSDSFALFPQRVFTTSNDFRSFYDGAGISFYLKEGDANLYVHFIGGYTNQRFAFKTTGVTSIAKRGESISQADLISTATGWKPFFLTTFRLSEEKYGFAFTGELRTLIQTGVKPIFSVALSKKFDLSKILEFK